MFIEAVDAKWKGSKVLCVGGPMNGQWVPSVQEPPLSYTLKTFITTYYRYGRMHQAHRVLTFDEEEQTPKDTHDLLFREWLKTAEGVPFQGVHKEWSAAT